MFATEEASRFVRATGARTGICSLLLPLVIGVALGTGCQDSSAAPPRCVPGAVVACACPTSAAGVQSCGPDGAFTACVCEVAATPSEAARPSAPGNSGPTWSALVAPWARIHFDPAGDAGYRFRAVSSSMWNPPGGPSVRLSVAARRQAVGGGDRHTASARAQLETILHLTGVWGGRRPEVLATFSLVSDGEMMGEVLPASGSGVSVVYAGQRVDGTLLVSLEELPASADNDPSGGRVKRILLGWNTTAGVPETVSVWEGATRDAPQHLRARQQ